MSDITLQNGLLTYFDNPAGFVQRDAAVVDVMFQTDYFADWLQRRGLRVQWTPGVMERLQTGQRLDSATAAPLKNIRIWQLRPEMPFRMRFIGYEHMLRDFGTPIPDNYRTAFDGQIGTNNLEELWNCFSCRSVDGKGGTPLAISDVVELYDQSGSVFFYVDRQGYRQIDFTEQEECQGMALTMT